MGITARSFKVMNIAFLFLVKFLKFEKKIQSIFTVQSQLMSHKVHISVHITNPIKQAIWVGLASQHCYQVIHHALVHMKKSFQLLWMNSKLAYKTGRRILRGEKVTAIERNRMRRALADIFLMFPFSVFIIIPGAELLIPFYAKFFPNAIPRDEFNVKM